MADATVSRNELSHLAGKDDNDSVWVENLLTADSVYRSDKTKDKYQFSPTGFVGSVTPVPVKVAKEGYFRRAILRGKLRFLTEEEEVARSADLVFAEEGESDADSLMAALSEGASEVGARYTKKGLSDDGTEKAAIPASEAVDRMRGKKSDKGASTVRRSDIKAKPIAAGDEPEVIEAIVTERVKEGEWQSDTGE